MPAFTAGFNFSSVDSNDCHSLLEPFMQDPFLLPPDPLPVPGLQEEQHMLRQGSLKRKSLDMNADFAAFLSCAGLLDSVDDDHAAQVWAVPGLPVVKQEPVAAASAPLALPTNNAAAVPAPAAAAPSAPALTIKRKQPPALTIKRQPVTTAGAARSTPRGRPSAAALPLATAPPAGLPLQPPASPQAAATNNLARAGVSAAALAAANIPAATRALLPTPLADEDSTSVATLPMPHKRQRISSHDDEATSTANDLVELPSGSYAGFMGGRSITTIGPTSSGGGSLAPTTSGAAAAAAAAAGPAAPAGAAPGAGEFKAVLVAKVLTKSDASSKRIILSRIAVEANLPQLGRSSIYSFTAADERAPSRAWPLVVKAWANGTNPKPVYVLEGVADILKYHRLGAGDALGITSTADGRLFVAVNTPQVRSAAAKPVLASVAFAQAAAEAAGAAGAGRGAASVSPASSSGGTRKRGAGDGADGGDGSAAEEPETMGGLVHSHGVLMCSRTPGCMRPAGHQGWCQGHGGYTARRQRSHK